MDFWMPKGVEHPADGEILFDGSLRHETKRTHHHWLLEITEPEQISYKKQAIEASSISKSDSSSLSWENLSTFRSLPSQFIGRLFRSDAMGPAGLGERNLRKSVIGEEFGNDSSVGLSMSYDIEEPDSCISCDGLRKVKVNQVKEQNIDLPIDLQEVYNEGSEETYTSMRQGEDVNNSLSGSQSFKKGDYSAFLFGGYQEEADINALGRPISSCEYIHNQSTAQSSKTELNKDLDGSDFNATIIHPSQVTKPILKTKSYAKPAKKETPDSFPPNVRSLMSTGMLDGVPVKYVSVSGEELHGVIKGSRYLCSCQSCNYSKALNAYEFERHAGCKTKHPNSHIYFENGKTIYQIVQELRSTRESELFDAIQTVTGSPINQKAFKIWKESYQAATRELRRIYGKEELNI
ncbi:unnamed protein product [Cuscuta campestris]|uniref:Tify domain-containing protein n=2 Tax=Cuscuta sect. Cleistogrammica TaxID=1824901 RepID=A0A484NCR8_9ASTE|nr:hypothetical protein DM860_006284 [Cuscuta australis]VFQ98870.1 unnamed protein product [Cuscuta campestris]